MQEVTVDVPPDLLADIDRYVGPGCPYEDRNEAVRTAIHRLIDNHAEITIRHRLIEEDGDGE